MQLILLERVEGLGNVGDEVSVRPGYARNFLLPKGKAIVATDGNRKVLERRRTQLEAHEQALLDAAKDKASKLNGLELTITAPTSDGEHLYGSVSTHELADLLEAQGYEIERRAILLDDNIKTVGEHAFRVRLHPDVIAELSVKVESESH
ncbi:MAG TPA: 50S ribosomal protein L9 [Mariprofundaceae bacterium]|nr:50S ribosomal protein L9 [Mariprofundaceae bacterium]